MLPKAISHEKPRLISYINVAKALAILLVCAYHFSIVGNISWTPEMTSGAKLTRAIFHVSTACVPLFFMASGALLVNSPRFNHRKNLRRSGITFLQFVIWTTITVQLIGLKRGVLGEIGAKEYLEQYFGSRAVVVDGNLLVDTGHLWFIPVYIAVVFMIPFLRALLEEEVAAMLSYFTLLLALIITIHVKSTLEIAAMLNEWAASLTLNLNRFTPFTKLGGAMLAYAMIGAALHRHRDVVRSRVPMALPIITVTLGIIGMYWEWHTSAVQTGKPYDAVFQGYSTFSGLVLSVSVFVLLMLVVGDVASSSRNWFQRTSDVVARNTLTVYYVHFIFGYTILPAVRQYFRATGLGPNLLKATVLVAASVVVGELLRRIRFIRFLAG